jgi:hypothetical protein
MRELYTHAAATTNKYKYGGAAGYFQHWSSAYPI